MLNEQNIRKLLRSEIKKLSVSRLNEGFPRDATQEEKKEYLQKKLEIFENLHDAVERYMESKWKDKVFLTGSLRDSYLGTDNLESTNIHYDFFIDVINEIHGKDIKSEIINDLKSMFGLDPSRYGEPINFQFYVKKWVKI